MLLLEYLLSKDTKQFLVLKTIKVNVASSKKYSELGDSFYRDNKVDSAFYYYNKSKELFVS
jgi:hypothetical protein